MDTLLYAKLTFDSLKHYRNAILVNLFYSVLSLCIQLIIFYMFIGSDYTQNDIWHITVIYIIITAFLTNTLSLNKVPIFSDKVVSGAYAVYAIRPIKYYKQTIYEQIGLTICNIFVNIIFIGAMLVCLFSFDTRFNFLLFIISFIFSVVLSSQFVTLVYSITTFTQKNNAPKALLQGVSSLFSGAMIPLFLWPDDLVVFVRYLPFASIINSPIEVAFNENLYLLLIQISWIVLLKLINHFVTDKVLSKQHHIGG